MTLTIPLSMKTIEYRAFFNATDITDVYYCGNSEQWENVDELGYNFYINEHTLRFDYVPNILGDVDGVNGIDNADLVMLARYLVVLEAFAGKHILASDMNCYGLVDNSDFIALGRIIVGI